MNKHLKQFLLGGLLFFSGIHASFAATQNEEIPYASRTAISGEAANEYFGLTMTNIGHFSAKETEDLAIAAPYAAANKGVVYVIFGTKNGQDWQTVNSIGDFEPENALKIYHSKSSANSIGTNLMGWALRQIGDLNGDGFDDLVIASHWYDQAYIIWGGPQHRTGEIRNASYNKQKKHHRHHRHHHKNDKQKSHRLTHVIDLNDIDNGDNTFGIRIRTLQPNGKPNTGGWFASSIGAIDYNQDGQIDLAIGDIEGVSGRGGAVIIYGAKKPIEEWQNIDIKRDNNNNWSVPKNLGAFIRPEITHYNNYPEPNLHSLNVNLGTQITRIGDVNGDGKEDFIITDAYANNPGRANVNSGAQGTGTAYLIYGGNFKFGNILDVKELTKSQATRIHGMQASYLSGATNTNDFNSVNEAFPNNGTVTALGNFFDDQDGLNAFAISSPYDSGKDNTRSGLVWILKGQQGGLNNNQGFLYLDAAHNQTNYLKTFNEKQGFALYANRSAKQLRGFGNNIIGNIDINNDGRPDLIIADPNALRNNIRLGAVYIVYGGTDFSGYADENAMINIEDLVDDAKASVIWGNKPDSGFGTSVAVGQFKGDKHITLVIGDAKTNNKTGQIVLLDNEALTGVKPSSISIISPESLDDAISDTPYQSAQFEASGGTQPYEFHIKSGDLPSTFTFKNHSLAGTPPQVNTSTTYHFVVEVNDKNGRKAEKNYSLVVQPAASAITIVSPEYLPDATAGVLYESPRNVAKGGTPPYLFELKSGNLPPDIHYYTSSLIGRPQQVDSTTKYQFVIGVTDSKGEKGQKSYSLFVHPSPITIISPINLKNAIAGSYYESEPLIATGGSEPYHFQAYKFPDWLKLNQENKLTGTPPYGAAKREYEVIVLVIDSNDSWQEKKYTLSVNLPPRS